MVLDKFKQIISLFRPINSLMVGFAVVVGAAVVSREEVFSNSVLMGFLTGFFISSFSMVTNVYYDVEVDKINMPSRPLPSGAVSLTSAKWLASLSLVVGLFFAFLTTPIHLAIATIFAIVAWVYNYRGKKHGISGNMLVAISISIPYLYGGLAVGRGLDPLIIFLSLTTFIAATGREVVKGITDLEGDKVRKIWSVARSRGTNEAAWIGSVLFIVAVISSWLPLITSAAGLIYGVLVIIPDGIFIYAAAAMVKRSTAQRARHVKKIALIGMLAGLLAFIFGGTFR